MWVREHRWDDVFFADSPRYANQTLGRHRVFVEPGATSPFYFERGGFRRRLRPDLVRHIHPNDLREYVSGLFKVKGFAGQVPGVRIRLTEDSNLQVVWKARSKYCVMGAYWRNGGFKKPPYPRRSSSGEFALLKKLPRLSRRWFKACPKQALQIDFKRETKAHLRHHFTGGRRHQRMCLSRSLLGCTTNIWTRKHSLHI